jgi:hypothetical protein
VELNKVSADGIVDGRQASPLLELVTKVEASIAPAAGAAAAAGAEDDAVPTEAVDGAVPAAVEPAAVELVVALDDVVAAELSEPQPLRAAKNETHTKPAHTFSASNLKIIVACPVAA